MAKALVTGGNKGIGLFITKSFLQAGDSVVVVARDFTEFPLSGTQNVTTISYDLSNINGIPALIKQIGDIDVLINNAGIVSNLDAGSYTEEMREHMVNVNLAAPVALITGYAPRFIKKGGGRIVNIASQAGVFGHYDIWYGATKAALINATKSFSAKYGSQGIVINAVSPGPVDVDVIRSVSNPERYERVKNRTILKRYAHPQEIADVVMWLAKESPEYINGNNHLLNNLTQSLDT